MLEPKSEHPEPSTDDLEYFEQEITILTQTIEKLSNDDEVILGLKKIISSIASELSNNPHLELNNQANPSKVIMVYGGKSSYITEQFLPLISQQLEMMGRTDLATLLTNAINVSNFKSDDKPDYDPNKALYSRSLSRGYVLPQEIVALAPTQVILIDDFSRTRSKVSGFSEAWKDYNPLSVLLVDSPIHSKSSPSYDLDTTRLVIGSDSLQGDLQKKVYSLIESLALLRSAYVRYRNKKYVQIDGEKFSTKLSAETVIKLRKFHKSVREIVAKINGVG